MIQYKLQKSYMDEICSVTIIGKNISIPFASGNSDFAEFKRQINEDEAELQDSDGNTMTAAEAKAYVATLP